MLSRDALSTRRGWAIAASMVAASMKPASCMARSTWLRRSRARFGWRYGLYGLGDWIMPASSAASGSVRFPTSLWKYMRDASPTPVMPKEPTWPR